MLTGYDIVILSGVFYDDLWTSKQQIARRLARKNRVLYVEPYLTVISPFSVPAETGHWKMAFGRQALRKHDGLHIFSPPPLLPFRQYVDAIQALNMRFYIASLKRTLRVLNFNQPVLWSFIHDAGDAFGRLGEIVSIYQCADDWAEMPLPHRVQHRIRALEAQVATRADLIFSAAQKNADRLRKFNPRSYYTPNGVDFELFNKAAILDLPVPAILNRIPKPRLTFVGTLHNWVDFDLLIYMAKRCPDWSIVIIGPQQVPVPQLSGLPNIYVLGKRPREELPAYLRHSQVCLIPFLINALTRVVNPLKLYEYMATGKPIVSTDIDEVHTAIPHVSVATDYDEFISATENALNTGNAGSSGRIAFARTCAWEARVDLLSKYIEQFLEIN